MSKLGVCDGCGQLTVVTRGVCAFCLLDGVRQRPKVSRRRVVVIPTTLDTFPTRARELSRATSIRAEDPEAWERILGRHVPDCY